MSSGFIAPVAAPAPEPSRARSSVREEDIGAADGFAAVLAGIPSLPTTEPGRLTSWPAVTVESGQARASEVFDAPTTDPRGQRLETLRQDARQESLAHSAAHRPSAREVRLGGEASDPGTRSGESGMPSREAGPETATVREGVRAAGESPPQGGTGAGSRLPMTPASSGLEHDKAASVKDAVSANPSPGPSIGATAPAEKTGVVASVASRGSSLTATPAQAVAEVLARSVSGGAKSEGATATTGAAGASPIGSATEVSRSVGEARRSAGRSAESTAGGGTNREATSFEKLVRAVRVEHGAKSSRATIELDPPELGRIRVEARMSGGALELSIQTETAAARQILGERLGELRQALHQQGVATGEFDLSGWSAEQSASGAAWEGFADSRQAAGASSNAEGHASDEATGTPSGGVREAEESAVAGTPWRPDGRLDVRV
ncbi:MAG: flagellar hook-length control protein FliK [Phycisphaerae bacterium]|nr:MAG: flagellar hook-length control protein FliK [Planctomycetota bacterium]KAB2936700.1 MAG: hypothetical protein F9K17_16675 [Phycisphaerae bacterium]MBE7457129.1 flagellar hook-length control protein FliK [Planctomycetia bacterium]MCK6463512.1 flagellar hook-length control protein FliK [Phycisphaerae bacterium]MCL4718994.1 flagellar hook-length control protein FliK [Phycisphaerae bacterium]